MLTVDDESDKILMYLIPSFSGPAFYFLHIFLSFSGTAFSALPNGKYVAQCV